MTTIHPHWATEEGAVEVPVNTRASAPVIPLSSVSRRPAAIVGIALVLTIGVFTLLQRGDIALPAQTVSSVDIRITPQGFVPQALAVTAGDTITWINEDTIPHILASTNLPTDGSSPLESPPIFPGQRFSVKIPETASENDYTYISRTSASLNGSLSVSALSAMAQAEQQASQPSINEPVASEQNVEKPVDDVLPTDWTTQDNTPPPTRLGLPTNPYTVATAAYRPGAAVITQTSSQRSVRTQEAPTAQTTPPAQYHRPASQPSSGMGSWVLFALAGYAVWILSRHALPAPERR